MCSLTSLDFLSLRPVSRTVAIAQNLSPKRLKAVNCNIFSSLALAFSRLVAAMNDPEPIVAQKALSLLHTLADTSQRVLLFCLQLQFDCVLADRMRVTNTLALLYKNMPSRGLLTWEFFAQRLNALHIEHQLSRDPALPPVDIYGQTEVGNAALQRKVHMARFALKRSSIIRSISGGHKTGEGSSAPEQTETEPNPSQADQELLDMKILSNLIGLMMKFMAYDSQKLILDDRNSLRHQVSGPSCIHLVDLYFRKALLLASIAGGAVETPGASVPLHADGAAVHDTSAHSSEHCLCECLSQRSASGHGREP